MKLVWKKKSVDVSARKRPRDDSGLPFGADDEDAVDGSQSPQKRKDLSGTPMVLDATPDGKELAETFQSQGNKLAEEGRFREALAKWDVALMAVPGNAVLYEQKAQVLLEMGEAWGAVKAATRAAKLDPSWAEAWITLARAQLNYGEPDAAISSLDKALAIKPASEDARVDRETALGLIDKRRQLQSSGSYVGEGRFSVVDKADANEEVEGTLAKLDEQ